MKIHIDKEKIEKKGFFGGGKSWVVISAYYELNEEERNLLNNNKNLLNMLAFDLPFRGPSGDTSGESSPTIKQLTDEKNEKKGKGYPIGCFFTNAEIQEAEEIINEGARTLKAELFGGNIGSSTTEI